KKLELYNTKFKPLADKYGVTINPPDKNCRTTNAHLATIYSREKGKLKEYRNRIYKGRWVEDLDIEDPKVLVKLGEEVGLDSKEIKNVINEKRYLSVLHSQRAQGKSIGIFGIPSFVIRGKIFWGVDVIEELKEEIEKVKQKLIEEQEKED
ncbi:MAG: DsbA family protein, partial [Nitrospinota bacterium]|nr:DsbA family protein [Nitrospinota bacterium]